MLNQTSCNLFKGEMFGIAFVSNRLLTSKAAYIK